MDTYALAVQQLKKAIENAIEKAITNGELPQAEPLRLSLKHPQTEATATLQQMRQWQAQRHSVCRLSKLHRLSHQTLTLRYNV